VRLTKGKKPILLHFRYFYTLFVPSSAKSFFYEKEETIEKAVFKNGGKKIEQ
jgi:hypothetical protein